MCIYRFKLGHPYPVKSATLVLPRSPLSEKREGPDRDRGRAGRAAALGRAPDYEPDKRDVLAMLDEIVDRGSPIAANRTLAHVAKFSRWLVDREVLEVDFTAGVKMPALERSRTRKLSHDEIAALWAAWDRMGYPFGMIGKLLLLTAQRRGEVASMRWDQLDLRRRVWILEATDTKTGEEHLLPLTDVVIELLAGVARIDGLPLLFPTSRAGGISAVSGFSKAKAMASRLSGVTGWTWHDLRRTCRSELARLGITSAVGERILNHNGGEGEIERIYNVHNYLPEMRRALELWAAEVERIVARTAARAGGVRCCPDVGSVAARLGMCTPKPRLPIEPPRRLLLSGSAIGRRYATNLGAACRRLSTRADARGHHTGRPAG
jgi:integrase